MNENKDEKYYNLLTVLIINLNTNINLVFYINIITFFHWTYGIGDPTATQVILRDSPGITS